jgi:2-deoxy-D-gluconate 3-dehydrogenase
MSIPSFLQNQFSLQGHTALVTGGTRGIGQAVAIALAEAGADIILIQRDASNTTTHDAILSLGRRSQIYPCDLSDPSSVSALIPRILADNPSLEIRILINCAGIQRRHPCAEFPDSDFNLVMQTNLNSVFTLTRDVGKHMLSLEPSPVTGRKGSIINFASLLSFQGGFTVPAYAASKGAVAQLTKSFANEWTSQGVNVNAIAPGYIDTEMNSALLADPVRNRSISERIPAGRVSLFSFVSHFLSWRVMYTRGKYLDADWYVQQWGTPDDFKGTVVYLASRASAYVSGHVMVVDGGWMGR